VKTSGFDFGLLLKSLILSEFVSMTERIAASNKETDSDYGNNNNSTIFNLTSDSDELN
jgi:hypothetical protein